MHRTDNVRDRIRRSETHVFVLHQLHRSRGVTPSPSRAKIHGQEGGSGYQLEELNGTTLYNIDSRG